MSIELNECGEYRTEEEMKTLLGRKVFVCGLIGVITCIDVCECVAMIEGEDLEEVEVFFSDLELIEEGVSL